MDSTYVKDGLEKWSKAWARNGWRTKAGQPVKNRELWEPLVLLAGERAGEVTFEWVKGHSGDPLNDLVDELAVVQRDAHRAVLGGATPGAPGGGGKLADLSAAEQRAERRLRDPRIPAGHLLVVLGHGPDKLGGWDPNPIADGVRRKLVDIFAGFHAIHPDLVVLTGLRPGAELLAAEAAIRADVPYAAVVAFPGMDRNLSAASRARFADLVGRSSAPIAFEKKTPATDDDFRKAMRRRDSWLVNAADQAILVWDEADDRFARVWSDLDRRLGADLIVLHP
jgi:hypothetical protein